MATMASTATVKPAWVLPGNAERAKPPRSEARPSGAPRAWGFRSSESSEEVVKGRRFEARRAQEREGNAI